MNKDQLVTALAKKAGITKKQTDVVLEALGESITESLKSDGKFALTGVATFTIKNTKPMAARKLGGKDIPAKPAGKRIHIKTSSVLKTAVVGD